MNASRLLLAEALLMQSHQAFAMGPVAAERADIKYLRGQYRFERRIVDLGIVREGDDGGAPVGCGAAENVIGPFGRDLDTGKTFAIGKGAARVDHSHAIAGERGDLRQRLGDVYRADESFKTQRVNLDVHVDTASLGRLDAQDVLLASGKPGTYTLATSLPGDVSLQLELQPGSTHYVHTRLRMIGNRVVVELVEVEEQVAKLHQAGAAGELIAI